jgi:hypothetical protein
VAVSVHWLAMHWLVAAQTFASLPAMLSIVKATGSQVDPLGVPQANSKDTDPTTKIPRKLFMFI